ncbi:MAG: transcriptional regulator [Balneola sp.]|nr:MAG: transcriptional regulator [Balneola sp.]
MPQRCRVCTHPRRKEIEKLIVSGQPYTQISREYGMSDDSVSYHAQNHLTAKLIKVAQEDEHNHITDILSGVNDILKRLERIFEEADRKDQKRLALDAIKELRTTYEFLAKVEVKKAELNRDKKEQGSRFIEEQITNGFMALSDNELHAFTQLVGKIYSADPDYELDPVGKLVVDQYKPVDLLKRSKPDRKIRMKRKRNKTPLEERSTPQTSDDSLSLDWDDLELDEFDTIPSIETDPRWLQEDINKGIR